MAAPPLWSPGTLYQPGDLVRPTSSGVVTQATLENPSFESGDTGWTWLGSGGTVGITQEAPTFDGTWRAGAALQSGSRRLLNDARIDCVPGDVVTCNCFLRAVPIGGGDARLNYATLLIQWYNAAGQALAPSYAYFGRQPGVNTGETALNVWKPFSISAVAPAGAAKWTFGADFNWPDDESMAWLIDAVSQSFATQAPSNPFVFRAIQSVAGYSAATEPAWPETLGETVVDNQVTWEAVAVDNVTWEANRILVSGSSEPTWPEGVAGSALDNTIAWTLDPLRVADERLPRSKLAAIAASKVFSADNDIAPFSATTNPLDWSTRDDAGFVPFGLQTYGANPITALGLYRGNLVISNSVGSQIWQVDEDPAGMALLDAIPIGCTFPKTMQPIGNDLAFLTELGVRNMGTVGAAVNLQAGYFGKPIDELVRTALAEARADDREPFAIYWPAQGQYWLIFGAEVFVLTVSDGAKGPSWSRYVFPDDIEYATVLGEDLYLRAGDLVWRVDETALTDDAAPADDTTAGTNTEFRMELTFPHLDLGILGREKQLIGFDLVGSGEVAVSIGYDQREPGYDANGPWTPLYTIEDADTLPGTVVPFPVAGPSFSLHLRFAPAQASELIAANLYVQDLRGTA